MAYRIYMADAVWGIAHGKGFDKRYIDIINQKPEETRTANEIIDQIRKGLEGVE